MTNTRFNPTPSGNLHIGHLYLILLNYHAAKKNNGKFIVRFDDDVKSLVNQMGREKLNKFCEEIKEDFSWIGIEPDLYTYESKEREENEKYLKNINMDFEMLEEPLDQEFFEKNRITPHVKSVDTPYPYVPYLTAVKVVQDWREGCGIIIRGEDLVSEFSLYCYFCKLLKIPVPEFYYVPKLMQCKKGESEDLLSDLINVSKTKGNFKLRDLREKGYSSKQIIDMLEELCLIDKEKGWSYENIKQKPVIYL